jgi:hypothetical protein
MSTQTSEWSKPAPASKAVYDPDASLEASEAHEEEKKEFDIIDNAHYQLSKNNTNYPFDKLEIGQGFFVPLENDSTMDKLMTATNKQANIYRTENSEVEKNDEGDDVLENFTVNARKRKPDGSFELDGDGQPKLTVSSGLRPKLIGPMFMVKAVHKDDEISENNKSEVDGVLVIRLD